MIKKRHAFCAAFCVAAALLLGACAGSAGSEDTPAPEAGGTSPVPEASKETGASSPDPDIRLASEVPPEESELGEPLPTPELPEVSEPPETPAEGSEPGSDAEPPQEETTWEYVPVASRPPISNVVVSARAEPVGDEYFDDAAFMGNSLVDGFRMFSGLSNCDYYAKTSMTILGIGGYLTQMSSREYGKVYMLLGINELTYNLDTLMRAYAKAIDRLTYDHPGVMIYIMSVSPVSAAKDASSKTFTMANVYRFNERLLQLAEEKNCYYIDLCDALAGDDGFLPADVTTDGIHFVASEYKVWLDYLRYHYIPVGGVPEDPETEPAEGPLEDPEAEPTENPEGESAEDPETEPAEDPAEDPEAEPAEGLPEDPGVEPAEDPVTEPAETPEAETTTEPVPESGPEMAA